MKYLAILDIALAFIKGGLSEGFDMSALKNVLRALLADGTCCDFLAFRLTLRQVFKKTALFDNAVQRLLQGIRVYGLGLTLSLSFARSIFVEAAFLFGVAARRTLPRSLRTRQHGYRSLDV